MHEKLSDPRRLSLEKRLTYLQEEYAAVSAQISSTLSAGDCLRLGRQAEQLEREMARTEDELARLTAGPDVPSEPHYPGNLVRRREYDRALAGLANPDQRIVLIAGEPGIGKTKLALQLATHYLNSRDDASAFDKVVWMPDPGKESKPLTLSTALNRIARELGSQALSELDDLDEQIRQVTSLLCSQRALLVFHDFDAVTDPALTQWLLHFQRWPSLSKILITCADRGRFPALFTVTLDPLDGESGLELLNQFVRDAELDEQSLELDLPALMAQTGGHPDLMKYSVSLLRTRSLSEVLGLLSSGNCEEAFDDVFSMHWQILHEPQHKNARDLLLALAILPYVPNGLTRTGVAESVGLRDEDFEQAVKRLDQLQFLVHPHKKHYRLCLTRSIRKFTELKLGDLKETQELPFLEFEQAVQQRWIASVERFVLPFQFPLRDLSILDKLEPEEGIVHAAIELAFRTRRFESVIHIADGIDHYYYVRGKWKVEKQAIDEWRVQAAEQLHNKCEEARAIAQQVQLWCRRTDITGEQFAKRLARLTELESCPDLTANVDVQVQHAFAFHQMTLADRDAARAEEHRLVARQILSRCRERETNRKPDPYFVIATRHWLATCLYKEGLMLEARDCFWEGLELAKLHDYERSAIHCRIYLAKIAIQGDEAAFADWTAELADLLSAAERCKDLRHQAQIHLAYALLYRKHRDRVAAEAAVQRATGLFEQIGLRDERDELETVTQEVAAMQRE